MKIKIGLKIYVIIIFFVIFLVSVMLLNNYYTKQHDYMSKAFFSLRHIVSKPDSILTLSMKTDINEALTGIRIVQGETKIYSALMTFFIFVISCLLFIFVITKLVSPLNDLQKASDSIKAGDYNIYIRPRGVKEVRDLAKSFNEMSKELENTQNKLLISEKQMIWKDLSRILTHEIKNPLTPIQLTTQRMEELFNSDKVKFEEIFPESLKLIYHEINNLQNLVTSFSSFAKDISLKPTVFDPAIALKEILKPYIEKYHVALNLREGYRVKFDNIHFYQVVTNIFQNAIESLEEKDSSEAIIGEKIYVDVEKSNSFVVIKIKDRGAGIISEDLTKIFEPYFTKKNKGTGLGLALVKKLCDANQCFVRVKSVLGEGSVFELILEDKSENTNNR